MSGINSTLFSFSYLTRVILQNQTLKSKRVDNSRQMTPQQMPLYFRFGHRSRTFWPGQSKSHHLFGWRNPEMARICLLLEIKKKIYIENMINKEYNVFKTFSLVMTSLIWYYLVFWWSNVTDIIKYLQNINEFLNIWVQVVGKL